MNELKKLKPKEKENYVCNKDFTKAIVDYNLECVDRREKGLPEPRIPEYIGTCILRISKGISSRPNFSRYSYREEMIMDGVENCIRSVSKFKVNTVTRSGNPNAFAYFTQICWFAFLRRIQKEKRQQEIKDLIILNSGGASFSEAEGDYHEMDSALEKIKDRSEENQAQKPKSKIKPLKKTETFSLDNFSNV